MEVNVAKYRMSSLHSAVIRIKVLCYILSDIVDTIVPLSKELAGCLKYLVIKKKKVTGFDS